MPSPILTLIFSLLNLALHTQIILTVKAKRFELRNNCSYAVWPAFSDASITPTSLKNQETLVVYLPNDQQVRLWARTGCQNSTGNFVCHTGDCGTGDSVCPNVLPNATTLVEFMRYSHNGLDFYDVSLVNGYNVDVSVTPGPGCAAAGCVFNVSSSCPGTLKLGSSCHGPCDVFRTPEYCCTGGSLCQPTSYSAKFKQACPRASTYPTDLTLSCWNSSGYTVTFCPSSTSVIRELSKPFRVSTLSTTPVPPLAPSPLRTPSAPPSSRTTNPGQTKAKRSWTSTLIVVPTSTAILILLLLGIWICRRKRKAKKRYQLEMEDIKTFESLQFDINTIRTATNNFSLNKKLGEGGFGEVYKGILGDGQEVAVKRLIQNSKQGIAEFKAEVILVAKLQHKNLVKLLGFCETSKEKILIYEFVRNSSLDRFLFDAYLDWQRRLNIIIGIGRGLLYLHEDSRLKIIHRDLKTENILLDEAMNPKISDFGLAKLFEEDQTQDNTKRIVGTRGYMAPEYAVTGHYSVKSDVYSFGVIVLEIISGQKSRFFGGLQLEETMLHRAWRLWTESKLLEFVDKRLNNKFPWEEVNRCFHIGLLCVQEDATQRPTMRLVLDALSRPSINLPKPKLPHFFGNSSNLEVDHPNLPHAYTGTEMITELHARD